MDSATNAAPPLATAPLPNAPYRGQNLSGHDFRGAHLAGADFTGATLIGARFDGAELHEAILDGSELAGANFSGAQMERVRARRAGFGNAIFDGACLLGACLEEASFTGATLRKADLRGAVLRGAHMRRAVLTEADCSRAIFRDADLTSTSVSHAVFQEADFRNAKLQGVTRYQSATFLGADIRDVNFAGAYLLRRYIMDEDYLHEFRSQSSLHEQLWRIWWITSDCGRSFLRFGLLTLLIAVAFGVLYTLVEVDYGSHPTWLSPFYFSLVTITTLGYGDVVPASVAAQLVAMSEVAIGYLLLGGLLSILATKMARRAE